tara:strand:+ start:619 stop:756 length:138 start_codon:yes stop_codon:yes gene_type:complete
MTYEVYNQVSGRIHSSWDFEETAKSIAKQENLNKGGNVTFKVRKA